MKKEFHTPKVIFMNIEPFDTELLVYVNKSTKQMLAHIKKVTPKSTYKEFVDKYDFNKGDHVIGTMYQIKGGFVLNLKAEKDYFRSFIGTVVHEATHVCHYLLRDRRIPLNEDTEEIYTYLTENIVEKILRKSY
jgi:predicted SprT family Zn-dependent metalloprotease